MFGGSRLALVGGGAFTLLLAFAAYGDLRTRRIRNWLVAVIAVSGLVYVALADSSGRGLLGSAEGFAIGLVCWLPFYLLGWLGAGDVKLYAAAGVWLGPARAVEGAVIAALAGAVLAVVWMIGTYGWKRSMSTLSVATAAPSILARAPDGKEARRTLPYGVALALGALAAGWMPSSLLH